MHPSFKVENYVTILPRREGGGVIIRKAITRSGEGNFFWVRLENEIRMISPSDLKMKIIPTTKLGSLCPECFQSFVWKDVFFQDELQCGCSE